MTLGTQAKYAVKHVFKQAVEFSRTIPPVDVKSIVLFTYSLEYTYSFYQLVFSLYILFANISLYKKIAYSMIVYGLVSIYVDIVANLITSIVVFTMRYMCNCYLTTLCIIVPDNYILAFVRMNIYHSLISTFIYA